MRFPLNPGSYNIGRNFQAHLNDPSSKAYPGQDYPSAEGTKIFAIEDGYAYMRIDSAGAKYVMLQGATGLWFFVHLSVFNGADRYVHEGDLIGFVGHTGYATGNHLHLGLKINNIYVDPVPYLTRVTSNNSYNSSMDYDTQIFGPSTYTVIENDSFSRIVQKLGLPDTEQNWNYLAIINALTIHSVIHPGQVLKTGLNPAPLPAVNDNEIQLLKDQIAKERQENADKIEQVKKVDAEAQAKLVALYDSKIAEINSKLEAKTIQQEQIAIDKVALEAELSKYQNAMHIDTGIITEVAADIINETIKGSGLLSKWNNFVELHFKSDILQSILKYDIFVILGWLLSLPTIGVILQNSEMPQKVVNFFNPLFGYSLTPQLFVAGVIGIMGIAVKLLLTRYDTNLDGKLNIEDTQILKNYKK
jgi:hypothetical protein